MQGEAWPDERQPEDGVDGGAVARVPLQHRVDQQTEVKCAGGRMAKKPQLRRAHLDYMAGVTIFFFGNKMTTKQETISQQVRPLAIILVLYSKNINRA